MPDDLLMSFRNTAGWKLEELLKKVQEEVELKLVRIQADPRIEAREVYKNGRRVMSLLSQAEVIWRDSQRRLDRIGSDGGPAGRPRIGIGSEA